MLKGHDDHVITCLQFSGNRIVSGSDDNTLKVTHLLVIRFFQIIRLLQFLCFRSVVFKQNFTLKFLWKIFLSLRLLFAFLLVCSILAKYLYFLRILVR